MLPSLISGILGGYAHIGGVYCGQELKAICKQLNMSLGRALTLQIVYELTASCTSVVAKSFSGAAFHFRTMDWEMNYLKDLTVELEFKKGGKTVFVATSWAGYIGILTGMVPQKYSVSINFRRLGEAITKNVWAGMKGAWPVGFIVRECISTCDSYQDFVENMANTKLMAPTYVIVCGAKEGEGCQITRNREGEVERKSLCDKDKPNFLLQCNCDWFDKNPETDILCSVARRLTVTRILNELYKVKEGVNEKDLWSLVSKYPVWNNETIYATVMVPSLSRCKSIILEKDPNHAQNLGKQFEKDKEEIQSILEKKSQLK